MTLGVVVVAPIGDKLTEVVWISVTETSRRYNRKNDKFVRNLNFGVWKTQTDMRCFIGS